jgi:3-hydroxyacyl-[acyl-carrier-protein] dehydratase
MFSPIHRHAVPLSALDCVVRIDEKGITTRKAITGNEPFFTGHYPNHPIYPGVFVVEAVCQAVHHHAVIYGGEAHLVEVRSTRFRLPLEPGDVLESECRCVPERDGEGLEVKAVCRSAKGEVADLKLRFNVESSRA